jgi:hypothetical protein
VRAGAAASLGCTAWGRRGFTTLDTAACCCCAAMMVLVRITDSAWLEGAPVQNEQHESVKSQLLHSQQRARELEGELASLRAEYQAACSAQSELVKERGQLEKRVSERRRVVGRWVAPLVRRRIG